MLLKRFRDPTSHLPQPAPSDSQEEVPGGTQEMADFTPVQEQHLEDMMGRVFHGMLESTVLPQGPPGPMGPQGPPGVGNGTNGTASWRPDELGFFDSDLDDDAIVGR